MNDAHNNTQIIQSLYEAFGKGDLEHVLGLMEDDVDWEFLGPKEIGHAGKRAGRKGAAQFFADLAGFAQVKEFAIDRIVAQDDAVIVLGKEVYQVKRTGRDWATGWMHGFFLRNGKISRFVEYCDTAAILAACAGTNKRD